MPLGTEVGLGPGDIVLHGDPAPSPRKGAHQPPTFRPTLLWHGRPSQQLLSSCENKYAFCDLYIFSCYTYLKYLVAVPLASEVDDDDDDDMMMMKFNQRNVVFLYFQQTKL